MLFDTADAYGGGRSEHAIGRWLARRGPEARERIVLSTKVFHSVQGNPADRGLARPDPPAGGWEPGAARRRAARSLPHPRARSRHAHRGHAGGPRRARLPRQGGSGGREQPERRRARRGPRRERGERPRPLRVGAERLQPARARRRGGRAPPLRASRPRLHALQPARRRLVDREVPSRRAVPERIAHDPFGPTPTAGSSTTGPSPPSRDSTKLRARAASTWRPSRSPGSSATSA